MVRVKPFDWRMLNADGNRNAEHAAATGVLEGTMAIAIANPAAVKRHALMTTGSRLSLPQSSLKVRNRD